MTESWGSRPEVEARAGLAALATSRMAQATGRLAALSGANRIQYPAVSI